MNDKEYLNKLADTMETAERMGKSEDSPEGSRYIMITDTLTIEIVGKLRDIANRMQVT